MAPGRRGSELEPWAKIKAAAAEALLTATQTAFDRAGILNPGARID